MVSTMGSLNYHHLFYFWTVAREGSIARAAAHLRLTEPTVGAQIHALERALGEKLFRRDGRTLVLTAAGRMAQRYATDIFTLGQEFQAAMAGASETRPATLTVGVAEAVPRLIMFRLLEPAVQGEDPFLVSCHSDTSERLLAKLVAHEVDIVISDGPLGTPAMRLHNRLLGESGLSFFASTELARRVGRGFPKTLDGAPFLMPAASTAMREALETWFASAGVRPDVRGDFTDSALLKTFGRAGIGVFAAPTAIEEEIRREYRVRVVGRITARRARFYVISASRAAQHPAVAVIASSARSRLFG